MSTKPIIFKEAKRDTGSEKSKPENWVRGGNDLDKASKTTCQQQDNRRRLKSSNNHRVQNQGLVEKNKKKCHIFIFIIDAGK